MNHLSKTHDPSATMKFKPEQPQTRDYSTSPANNVTLLQSTSYSGVHYKSATIVSTFFPMSSSTIENTISNNLLQISRIGFTQTRKKPVQVKGTFGQLAKQDSS